MTPTAVVFDLGKVLVDFDYRIVSNRLAARGNMSPAQIRALIDHSPLLFQLETGLMTNEQFYAEAVKTTGFDGSFEEFASIFGDIFSEMPEMIAFQAMLRRHGVPTYIFSNTNELAVRHIRRAFPFFENFNGYVYSYQHRAMKPNPRLYEVIEEQSGCCGPAILYLDDRAENVATGAARGWQTVLHRNAAETLAIAASLGLPTK